MRPLVARLGAAGVAVAGASLLIMVLLGAFDIIGTKLDRPIPGVLEATEALMVLGVFLALPYTQAKRQHIAVDLVVTRLGPAARRILDLLTLGLTLFVFSLIAWRGWVLAAKSVAIREYANGIVPFPVYPAKIALAVGASLMVCQIILDFAAELRGSKAADIALPPV